MSIVNPKYSRLYAQQTYLADEVVLVQARKKAQRYIRRSNWYADLLEVDQSAVQIEAWVAGWKRELADGKAHPSPMSRKGQVSQYDKNRSARPPVLQTA